MEGRAPPRPTTQAPKNRLHLAPKEFTTIETTPNNIHEFSDRLSPMLVKELRQGLRTKGFLTAFLVIQGILALSVLAAQESSSSGDGSFFWILGLALVTVLPLRALAAFSTEESRENLDLVRLTKLSTWRIVLGKWSALTAQSILFTTTILPYVVLRYFVGGVNPLLDLAWVITLLAIGATFSAIAIALSTIAAPVARLSGAAAMIIGSLFLLGASFDQDYRLGGLPGHGILTWLFLLTIIAGTLLFTLLSAAVPIASSAENYATKRRIVVFVGLAAILVATHLNTFLNINSNSKGEYLALMSCAATFTGFLAAFGESLPSKASSLLPMAPGWRSAIPFGAICALITATTLCIHQSYDTAQTLIIGGSAVATLLAPAAIAILTRRLFTNRVVAYLCTVALTMIPLACFIAITESLSISQNSLSFALTGSTVPPFIFGSALAGKMSHHEPYYLLATALHLTFIGLIFVFTLRRNREA